MRSNCKSGESIPLLIKTSSPGKSCLNFFTNLSVEPVVLLHTFGWSLSELQLMNQIIYQSCAVTFDANMCSSMLTDDINMYLEEIVQPYASQISMVIVILSSVMPALAALLLAPWSDQFGRKGIIVTALLGYLITNLLVALISYLSSYYIINPWVYVIAHIPVAFLGGCSVFNVGVYSYLHDTTNQQGRTVRMGVLHGCTMFGVLSGLLVSRYLSEFASLSVLYTISALTALISIIYLSVALEESVNIDVNVESYSSIDRIKALFNITLVSKMMSTITKPRPNYERLITWLLIVLGGLVEFASAGRILFFLYTRYEFQWNTNSYRLWLAAELTTIMLGNMFGIAILKKMFKASDVVLLIISTINHIGDYLIKGLSWQDWQLYLTILTPLKGTDGAAVRSMLSDILPSEDIGKIYAMDFCVKAVMPILSLFSLTYLYNYTMDSTPSLYLFVTGAVFIVNLLLIGIIYYLMVLRNRSIETFSHRSRSHRMHPQSHK
ncbi:proton-coupled folate transporter-like [Sabethes cyaneus]|uniref:proton-coupled folate transporter-like n=1 Tax=Sabethes cyaneus TaxID=53552 RepID=UPI00237D7488|nr:proton-coupled folate transporter-like [Sabethes cyaneus]